MCLEPHFISDDATGLGRVVVCRKCWQCRDRRVSDWVGRCIAEGRTAAASSYVTLTYGREDGSPDHLRASVLTYSDFQKWLKRLRKNGYPVRYLVTGEYGGDKGRTHWHALLFWLRKPPEIKVRTERVTQALWDDGFSYWDDIGKDTARYVCKYVLKDTADELKQGHLQMSKVPPLGSEYFAGLALRYVKEGLSPRDKTYKFRDVIGADGLPKKFYLGGRSLELFFEAFVFWWELLRPTRPWPWSPLVDDYLDRLEGDWREVTSGRRISLEGRFADGTLVSEADDPALNDVEGLPRILHWMLPERLRWSNRFGCAFYETEGLFSVPLYWHNEGGEYRWQNVPPAAQDRPRRLLHVRPEMLRPVKPKYVTRMDWPRPGS